MLVIKAKVNQYIKSGNTMFVYSVGSSSTDPKVVAKELADYKEKQGVNYREDDKTKDPLFFSQDIVIVGSELVYRTKSSRFGVNRDLEGEKVQQDFFKNKRVGELAGDAAFMGISLGNMRNMLLAKYA